MLLLYTMNEEIMSRITSSTLSPLVMRALWPSLNQIVYSFLTKQYNAMNVWMNVRIVMFEQKIFDLGYIVHVACLTFFYLRPSEITTSTNLIHHLLLS